MKKRMIKSMVIGLLASSSLFLCGNRIKAAEALPQEIAADSQTPAIMQMQVGAVAVGEVLTEGTSLKVYVAVQALPGSVGLDHVNIQFRNQANDRSVTKILRDRDLANGIYAGWLEMSIYEPAGIFELDKVILQDKAGAYVKYCRAEDLDDNRGYVALPVTAAFGVGNGVDVLDETPPALGAVIVTPSQTAKESELTVYAAVADDFSGVDTVSIRFENENGKAISLELDWDGELYTGKIKKSQTKEAGTYRVKRVTVTDNMGNSKVYRGGDGPFAGEPCFVVEEVAEWMTGCGKAWLLK